MKSILKFLFTMDGRATRKQFWLNYLLTLIGLNMAISVLLMVILMGFTGMLSSSASELIGLVFAAGAGLLYLFMTVVNIWASVAVPMKRFHDRNMSGWWVLWFGLIIYGGYFLGLVMIDNMFGFGDAERFAGITLLSAAGLALLGQFVILGFLPGTVGENKYGADPLRPLGVDDVSELFR